MLPCTAEVCGHISDTHHTPCRVVQSAQPIVDVPI